MWTFFGLAPEYKASLHEEIFNLCYYSNGGFSHQEVYFMPVHLRKFYLNKLVSLKKQEAQQNEAASGGQKSTPSIARPNIKR